MSTTRHHDRNRILRRLEPMLGEMDRIVVDGRNLAAPAIRAACFGLVMMHASGLVGTSKSTCLSAAGWDEGASYFRLISTKNRLISVQVDQREIELLVEQLGDDRFSVRESATEQLLARGCSVVPHLESALAHADREVRFRARRILTIVQRNELNRRIERFHRGELERGGESLPAWPEFAELVGDDADNREMFVEMNKLEPTLLAAIQAPIEEANRVFARRIDQLHAARKRELFVSEQPASILAMLFLTTRQELSIDEHSAHILFGLLTDQTEIGELRGGRNRELVSKLLAPWLSRQISAPKYQVFALGMLFEIESVLELALEVLQQPEESTALTRRFALQVVAKFGDERHIPLLVRMISDQSRVAARTSANQTRVTYVGDLALATCVHLAGLNLAEYGFGAVVRHEDFVFVESSLGFLTPEARRLASEAWFKSFTQDDFTQDDMSSRDTSMGGDARENDN